MKKHTNWDYQEAHINKHDWHGSLRKQHTNRVRGTIWCQFWLFDILHCKCSKILSITVKFVSLPSSINHLLCEWGSFLFLVHLACEKAFREAPHNHLVLVIVPPSTVWTGNQTNLGDKADNGVGEWEWDSLFTHISRHVAHVLHS